MKLYLFSLALCASILLPLSVRAQPTFGQVAATIPGNAAKLVADPMRNRVYAVLTGSDAVMVIDTTTFNTTTITVGSEPVDLSISPDNITLYVANSKSSEPAISAIDLHTLAVTSTFMMAGGATNVVAGPGGYLYVSLSNSDYLFQLDTATWNVASANGNCRIRYTSQARSGWFHSVRC